MASRQSENSTRSSESIHTTQTGKETEFVSYHQDDLHPDNAHVNSPTLFDAPAVCLVGSEANFQITEQRLPGSGASLSDSGLRQTSIPLPVLVFQENELLVDCYSHRLSRILSIYNGSFSPFRANALSSWTRSPLLFPLFKFLAGAYQLNLTGERKIDLYVNEARINTLNQLSYNLSEFDSISCVKKIELILVIIIFGLSSSWYDLDDFGLTHYNAAARLLQDLNVKETKVPVQNCQYFEECLVYWWMILSFVCDPSQQIIEPPRSLVAMCPMTRHTIPHPLTGVSSQVQYLLGKVGYLVFAQRRRILARPMTRTEDLLQSLANIEEARSLESELQNMDLPSVGSIMDPKDPDTPVADLLNMANAYRLCGLLLLYHAFPDLLRTKLASGANQADSDHCSIDTGSMQEYSVSLALHALQILQDNNNNSGTQTIEAILLVIISGELLCVRPRGTKNQGPGLHLPQEDMVGNANSQEQFGGENVQLRDSVQEGRSAVSARFERVQSVLPFKTIDRMRKLVLKTWDLMDQGNDTFWVDVMIESRWRFLMI